MWLLKALGRYRSASQDNIPPAVFHSIEYVLYPPAMEPYRVSDRLGEVLADWKMAMIGTIHKEVLGIRLETTDRQVHNHYRANA